MNNEFIILKGCKENNLNNIFLKILKRKIIIFIGVLGFGKLFIVFEIIVKEL